MAISELRTGFGHSDLSGKFSSSCFIGCDMTIRCTCYFPRPFTRPFGRGTVRAFVGVSPPGILLLISGGPARFLQLLCRRLTSAARSMRLTVHPVRSRTHSGSPGVIPMAFDTRAPGIPVWPIMDRGLFRVLPDRPTRPAVPGSWSSPRIFAAPRLGGAASSPGTVAGYPVAMPLHPSPPSGWIRDLPSVELPSPAAHPLVIGLCPAHNLALQPTALRRLS